VAATAGNPGEKADTALVRRFAGKTVTWEGTVKQSFPADGSPTTLEMMPDPSASGLTFQIRGQTIKAMLLFHLRPDSASVGSWTKLAPGTRVRFRATLADFVYLTAGPTVNVGASGGVPLP